MKKWTLLLALVLVMASSAVFAEGTPKFAVVNFQLALQKVNAGQSAREKLKSSYESKKQEIESAKAQWQKDADELKKQSSVLSQEAMQEKAQAMQKRLMDIQTKASNYERELAQSDAETTKQIITSFQTYIQEIASQKGYDMVFENSAQIVVYAANAPDITNELIELFNKKGVKK